MSAGLKNIVTIIFFLTVGIDNRCHGQPCGKYCTKEKFRFTINKKHAFHTDTSLVKTNGIYMCMPQSNDGTPRYKFIRFFENGRTYLSGDYCSFPMPDAIEDLKFGFYGAYTVSGDSVIVEMYGENGYGKTIFLPINNGLKETMYSKRKLLGRSVFTPVPNNSYKFIRKQLGSKSTW